MACRATKEVDATGAYTRLWDTVSLCSPIIGRVLLEWRTNIARLLNMMHVWIWGKTWLKRSLKGKTALGRIFTSGLFK